MKKRVVASLKKLYAWLSARWQDACGKVSPIIHRVRESVARVGGRLPALRESVEEKTHGLAERGRERLAMLQDRLSRLREPAADDGVFIDGAISHVFAARDYPRSRTRRYIVHLPPEYDENSPLPLVMVLHGCRQTHLDIRRITGFDAVADEQGFIVVYPFITGYSGLRFRNCWGFWYPAETSAGSGEVEDLWQIIEEVRSRYRVDEGRIHVAGLSSGAGMTVAMLVAHAGRIASGAVVAGVPYSETVEAVSFFPNSPSKLKPVYQIVVDMRQALPVRSRPPPVFIVHSHDDPTVDIEAAHNIRDSWGHCHAIDTHLPHHSHAGESRGTAWEHRQYGQSGDSVVETFFVKGPEHGWYGGHPGPYSFPDAPDISRHIWRFFEQHPL